MRVVVVEDEPRLAELVARALETEGHSVVKAGTAADAVWAVGTTSPDLVLLDLGLPDRDGTRVLEDIRQRRPGLPVIVMSARSELGDRVGALDLGADDYLVKPFALDELLARVRARLRAADQPTSTHLLVGTVDVDLAARRVVRAGLEAVLTAREYDLLVHLMRHHGQVLSKAQLLAGVWGITSDPDSKVVEVYVSQLRQRLRRPGLPDPIETIRNAGYRFREV